MSRCRIIGVFQILANFIVRFQCYKFFDFSILVEFFLVFQGGLDVFVDESFMDDFSKLGIKLVSFEYFQGVSVYGFKMMNDFIGRFEKVFWSSFFYFYSFSYVVQIQSLRKDVFSYCDYGIWRGKFILLVILILFLSIWCRKFQCLSLLLY